MGLSCYFTDSFSFCPYLLDETPLRPKVKSKNIPLYLILCWESSENPSKKYLIYAESKKIETQEALSCCLNKVNRGRTGAVPKTIVIPKSKISLINRKKGILINTFQVQAI